METITFLCLLTLTWLFVTGAAPIQFIKKLLKIDNDSKPKKLFGKLAQKFVNCALCSGFWIGLIYYSFNGYEHYFLYACGVSVCAEIVYRLINFLLNNVLTSLK